MTDEESAPADGVETATSLPVGRRTYLTALAASAATAGEVAADTPDGAEPGESTDSTGDFPFNYGWDLTASEAGTNRDLGYGYGPYGGDGPNGGDIPPIATALPPKNIDPGQDNLYRDVRGDGWKPNTADQDAFTILDVQALFNNLNNQDLQDNSANFKFQGGSGNVTTLDVQALFNDL